MDIPISGFSAADFSSGTVEVGLVPLVSCRGARQVVPQFRDLEHRQHLTLAHHITDVDIDPLHVSRHLRHHFHFLKGSEFTGKG